MWNWSASLLCSKLAAPPIPLLSPTSAAKAVPRNERFLKGVFGEIEIAEDADEGRQDAPVVLAVDPLDCPGGLPFR